MRIVIVLLFCFYYSSISAQDTFWKVMDMSGDDDENPYAMRSEMILSSSLESIVVMGLVACTTISLPQTESCYYSEIIRELHQIERSLF